MTHQPIITVLDIENSPLKGYSWGVYEQNILKVLEPSKIMSFAAKQLGSNEATVKCLADYPSYKAGGLDDKEIVQELWEVLDKSDVVIGQNSDKHDIPKIYARFVIHGMKPPSSFKSIDTLKVAKRFFKFDSNKLDDLGAYLGVGRKMNNGGFSLWERCIAGDMSAWAIMKDYNLQDIILDEDVYLRLRPFDTRHPDIAFLADPENKSDACGTCQSTNLQKRGFNYTKTTRKQKYQCQDCFSWSSGTPERIKK